MFDPTNLNATVCKLTHLILTQCTLIHLYTSTVTTHQATSIKLWSRTSCTYISYNSTQAQIHKSKHKRARTPTQPHPHIHTHPHTHPHPHPYPHPHPQNPTPTPTPTHTPAEGGEEVHEGVAVVLAAKPPCVVRLARRRDRRGLRCCLEGASMHAVTCVWWDRVISYARPCL